MWLSARCSFVGFAWLAWVFNNAVSVLHLVGCWASFPLEKHGMGCYMACLQQMKACARQVAEHWQWLLCMVVATASGIHCHCIACHINFIPFRHCITTFIFLQCTACIIYKDSLLWEHSLTAYGCKLLPSCGCSTDVTPVLIFTEFSSLVKPPAAHQKYTLPVQ